MLLSGLLLLGAIPAQCAAQKLRGVPVLRVRARGLAVETGGSLSLNFFPLSDSAPMMAGQGVGAVNLGKVSYIGTSSVPGVKIQRAGNAFYVESAVGLRIGDSGAAGGGTVILSAWLQSPVDPYQVYLDGVALSMKPTCVDAQTALGVITRHVLRIRVPADTSDNQSKLQTEIGLQVIRN